MTSTFPSEMRNTTPAIDGLTPFEDWVVRRRFANDFSTSFHTLHEQSGVPIYKLKHIETEAVRKIVQSLLKDNHELQK